VYDALFRHVLSRLPAESAHHLAFGGLRALMALPFVKSFAHAWLAPQGPALSVKALGLEFPGPLGLAAGFDKDALGPDALGALGFGFVEIGTVTAEAQDGNPRPRLFRLPADRALVNRMGFNNRGAAAAAARLARRRGTTIVGVNIGKTKRVPDEAAAEDYATSARLLAPYADYCVVNVSSPNTPGLRDLQRTEALRPILGRVRDALDAARPSRRVPLLVKVAPDLADDDVDAVGALALELGLDGIVATNTTIRRTPLVSPVEAIERCGAGGLSGPPVKARALDVLARLSATLGDRVLLVAAGGITTGEDAFERLAHGATLLQAYTGFVYEGPLFAARVHRELVALLEARGIASVSELTASRLSDASSPA
jgi:dihydroorotate dehydrogenase